MMMSVFVDDFDGSFEVDDGLVIVVELLRLVPQLDQSFNYILVVLPIETDHYLETLQQILHTLLVVPHPLIHLPQVEIHQSHLHVSATPTFVNPDGPYVVFDTLFVLLLLL